MFEFVRKHNKVMQVMLFLLIVPSFVLFGLDGYRNSGEQGAAVAKVDGRDIKQSEWDAAHKSEVDRLRASMPSLDPKLLDSPEAKYATLERLVRDKVLAAAAQKSHLVTSDVRLARDLQDNQSIASLRRPDGTLDMDRYRQLVGSQGMTPEMFEARVRADLSTRQVIQGVAGTGFASGAQADVSLNAFFERREIQVARFNTSDYASKISPSDAELETYYKNNPALFQAPEQADIDFVVLDLDAVKRNITINEADLKTYFEQNSAKLSGQEERRASHILIASPKSAAAAERQKAKAKADELLATVRKSPDSFADVARKNSQDPGSAVNGGDLDFFARGAMVKPFEDAAFTMKKGDVSDVVESDFGFHIIKLTDVRAPKARSFEEMKPEHEADLKKQQAQRKFAETADAFTNSVEQDDTMKQIGERLKLEVKTAQGVTRKPAANVIGALANAKFLSAVFSPDSVEKKHNTPAIEIASNQIVAAHVSKYTPARTLPLAEVKDRVRERVLAVQGAELARKEGAGSLAKWKASPAAATLPEAVVVSREQTQKLPATVVEAAMRADASALPAFAGIDLGNQGYAVVKVNRIVPREPATEASAKQDRSQYAQWWTSAENLAYYALLKDRFKVQMKVAKPAIRTAEEMMQPTMTQ
ncbi:MAG: SurA N-terminal domain-containing protein [Bdellovibrionales bacterium]|nr:SurA N-terminal domain-containing protein [Ramlibacter sp.]